MRITGLFLLLGVLSSTLAFADLPRAPRQWLRVKLTGKSVEEIRKLMELPLDVLTEGPVADELEVLADADQLRQIQTLGFSFEIQVDDLQSYERTLRQQGYLDHFHSYGQMLEEMQAVAAAHPDIAKLVDIGDGWEKTEGRAERDLWAMKISDNVDREEREEAEVLYMGCHHARELITPEIVLYFMHYLVDRYGEDPEVSYLVNNRQIWLVPMVNPDGHEYVFTDDLWWRKNRRRNNDGSFGVDLNRNYGFKWGYDDTGSSAFPWSEIYRGAAPFSEPETRAIRDLVDAHHFSISLSYHSYGRLWLFPWGYVPQDTPDHSAFKAIADSCVAYNGYQAGNVRSGTIYLTNGDVDDWLYGEQSTKTKVFGFTPEVGRRFHPDTTEISILIEENLGPNLFVAWAAERYAPRPEIQHTPLADTRSAGPYRVTVKVSSPAFPLDSAGVYVHFNDNGYVPLDSLQMKPTANPGEFTAEIPSFGSNVTIYYYFSARDSVPRVAYLPANAPDSLFSFHVGAVTGISDTQGENELSATTYALHPNFPNPFNATTVISYQVSDVGYQWSAKEQAVTLRIYDVLARPVRTLVDGVQPPGYYRVLWDGRDDEGRNVTTGLYFARLRVGEFSTWGKLMLLR